MTTALSAWQNMPDGTPDGHTICQLIEHWDSPEHLNSPEHVDSSVPETGNKGVTLHE